VLFVGEGHSKKVNVLTIVKQTVWSGGSDNNICIWNFPSQFHQTHESHKKPIVIKPNLVLETHTGPVHCISQVGDKVWSSGYDKIFAIWNTESDITLQSKLNSGHESRVSGLAPGMQGTTVWATSFDSTLSVWV